MNMKSILTYLAVLILSFNVFAREVQEKPENSRTEQMSSVVKTALNQENSPDTHLATDIVNSQTIPQSSGKKPSEFITAVTIYLIIIIVYSIYGFKASSKKVRN